MKPKAPNKAESHELYGKHQRVRLAIFKIGPAYVAVKSVGGMLLGRQAKTAIGFGPNWVTVHSGPVDEMRELCERLGAIIDRYATSIGIKRPAVSEEL